MGNLSIYRKGFISIQPTQFLYFSKNIYKKDMSDVLRNQLIKNWSFHFTISVIYIFKHVWIKKKDVKIMSWYRKKKTPSIMPEIKNTIIKCWIEIASRLIWEKFFTFTKRRKSMFWFFCFVSSESKEGWTLIFHVSVI